MQSLFENLFVDISQISEHIFGNNQPSHLTRSCLICQPNSPIQSHCQKKQILLPVSFPCDKDFELAKINVSQNVAKRLMFFGNKHTRHAKELVLFLTSLNYTIDNRPVATGNLIIICLEHDIPQKTFQENISSANKVVCIVDPNHVTMIMNPNVFYIFITNIVQIRKLHLCLLQRIGRATVAEMIDICTKNGIDTKCENTNLFQTSFVY